MGETVSYERHFLSAAWGDMPADEFQALVDDIAVHGQRDPIVIFDGSVLDGWHRYQACEQLLRNVKATELDAEEDPVAWVISKNAKRRSLSAGQRAMAVVECQKWAPPHRQRSPHPVRTYLRRRRKWLRKLVLGRARSSRRRRLSLAHHQRSEPP